MTLKVSFPRVSWAHTSSRVALHSFTLVRHLLRSSSPQKERTSSFISWFHSWAIGLPATMFLKLHRLPFTIQYYNVHQLKENKH